MNCLQFNSIRFSSISSRSYLECDNGCAVRSLHLGFCRRSRRLRMSALKVVSPSENDEMPEGKSEVYSNEMTQAMGAVLTYRHELGMNYNFILDDLIVGSCLQTPIDVDKLRQIGVKTIFCVQQDSDLEYFGVDIKSIQQHTGEYTNIHHCRAPIRDFDAFDLRLRLPAVVSKLYKEINQNGGITYIHCTAGLGRAPAVALAYMYWVLGFRLNDAHDLLLNKRSCFPKAYAIKCATVDILSGQRKKYVTLNWHGDNCSTVEVSGLDIGWGQRIPLRFDQGKGLWSLRRELPEGHYEYKYIVDGEWTCSSTDQITNANTDGHVNNCIDVMCEDLDGEARERRERLMGDGDLTYNERQTIVQFLDSYKDEDLIVNLSLEENH